MGVLMMSAHLRHEIAVPDPAAAVSYSQAE